MSQQCSRTHLCAKAAPDADRSCAIFHMLHRDLRSLYDWIFFGKDNQPRHRLCHIGCICLFPCHYPSHHWSAIYHHIILDLGSTGQFQTLIYWQPHRHSRNRWCDNFSGYGQIFMRKCFPLHRFIDTIKSSHITYYTAGHQRNSCWRNYLSCHLIYDCLFISCGEKTI